MHGTVVRRGWLCLCVVHGRVGVSCMVGLVCRALRCLCVVYGGVCVVHGRVGVSCMVECLSCTIMSLTCYMYGIEFT